MLLGFKKQFVPKIENGSKIFTLRDKPKRMPRVGETLHMYTGLRTKHCQFITKEHTLKSMQVVRLRIIRISGDAGFSVTIAVDGRQISTKEFYDFAKHDGFKSTTEFSEYWLYDTKKKKKLDSITTNVIMFHWTDFKY